MRILIADDHELLRDTLRLYLQKEADIAVDTAPDLSAAMEMVRRAGPYELVLLDWQMPGMQGLEGLAEMKRLSGERPVALISGVATRREAQAALDAGAAGFLPKTLAAKSLVAAVRFMAMGEVYAPLDFMTAPEAETAHPLAQKLSRREFQVLEGLTEGKSNKEIARDLDVQETTVKLHVKTLYRKMGVTNRTQAALSAREAGLF